MSAESNQCIRAHLSTAEEDVGFAVEMTTKCTKLKVLELALSFEMLALSSRSFLNVIMQHINISSNSVTVESPVIRYGESSMRCVQGSIS